MAPPPYDETIDAAVKAEEKKTGKKAPYFGAASRDEAIMLGAWKRIGKAWKNRAPDTCWQAYVKRHGNERQDARKVVYAAAAKEEVLRGERDADLKKAAGRCVQLGLDVYKCTNQFVVGVDQETVRKRLGALGYGKHAETWAAALDDELDAEEKKYVGLSFFDCDRDACTITRIDFYEDSPTPLVPVAWCAVEGYPGETPVALAEVDDYIAGREPPEPEAPPEPTPLPPLPEPPKPAPPPTTRAGKRAAALAAAKSENARQVNKKARKKAVADARAWKAEKKNDVEPNDARYRDWRPPINSIESDARALAIKIDEAIAALGVGKLLDTATVATKLPRRRRRPASFEAPSTLLVPDAIDARRRAAHLQITLRSRRVINPFPRKLAPVEGTPAERLDMLQRIAGVRVKIEDDPNGSKMTLVAGFYQDQIRRAVGEARVRFRGGDEVTVEIAPGVPANLRRVGGEGLWCMGPNDGTLSDQGRAMLFWVTEEADAAPPGELKDALVWWTGCLGRWAAARCVLAELVFYLPDIAGKIHDDKEEPDLKNRHCHLHRGGQPKGARKCGSVSLRLAHTVIGRRPMSFHDKDGHLVTIQRGPGRGVLFVDGAHTHERGIVKHRNDAGAEAGATLIVTFRRHVSSAFADLSEAERLFVQTGIALFH